MAAPDLLLALLNASGPSGHEEEPARIWREAAAQFGEGRHRLIGDFTDRPQSQIELHTARQIQRLTQEALAGGIV